MNHTLIQAALLAAILAMVPRESQAKAEPIRVLWEEGVENAYPRWSLDGERILFQSNGTGSWQIYVMDRDGENRQRLTHDEFNNNFLDWSPDNSQIAFVSDRDDNEEIYVTSFDGSQVRRLTNHPARDIHPYWSPDGQYLLFNSNRDDESGFDVYRISVDGTELKRLTFTEEVETCARLSPNGSRMIMLHGGENDEVVVADSSANNLINLTQTRAAEGWPSWSPDGKQIVYSCDETGTFALYLMEADGSNRRQLTFPTGFARDARAQISPDGKEIVFNRQIGPTIGVYILPLAQE